MFVPALFDHTVIITATLSTTPTSYFLPKKLRMPFSPSSFRPFSSTLSPPSEIRRTSFSRTLGTGPCTAAVKTGVLEIPCTCSEGAFTLTSQSTLEVTKCQQCDHLLSEHADFHTKSSSMESNHTRQHSQRKCEILCHQRTYLELTIL